MVKVKICGITNLEDALASAEAGADALGFNFYTQSPRYIMAAQARKIIDRLPPFVSKVGIFVNEKREVIQKIQKESGLDVLQFHGDELPSECDGFEVPVIKVFSVKHPIESAKLYPFISAILADSPHDGNYGGTGRSFEWKLLEPWKSLGKLLILSGGLDLENIEEAIRQVKPYAVDACSRLEDAPGKKNHQKVKLFIEKAKSIVCI